MRDIRSLSSIAGAGASLAQVGASTEASGINHVYSDFHPGDGANYGATIDLTTIGLVVGDFMVAIAWAGSFFGDDPGDTYGATEVTTSGWTLISTDLHSGKGALTYFRTADGTETEVAGNALRNGGLMVSVVRGVGYPNPTDISASDFYFGAGGGNTESDFLALSDTSFDAVLAMASAGDNDFAPSIWADTTLARIGFLGGASVGEGEGGTMQLMDGPDASGPISMGAGSNINIALLIRIGLRGI